MDNYLRWKRNKKGPEPLTTFELPWKTLKIITDTWYDKPLGDINNNDVENCANDIKYHSTIFTTSKFTNQIESKWKHVAHPHFNLLHFIILVLMCLLLTAIVIIVIMNKEKQVTCVTTACIQAAVTVVKYMNATVNPCDNFYDFACGNYINEPSIRDEDVFKTMTSNVDIQLKVLFEEILSKSKSARCYKLLTKMYDVCFKTSPNMHWKNIKDVLRNLGGWPILEKQNWNESNFDWTELIYKMRKIGLDHNYFITIDTYLSSKNELPYLIVDVMTVPTMDRRIETEILLELTNRLGENKSSAESDIKDVVQFRQNISALSRTNGDFRNITINDLQTMCPTVDWIAYISTVINIPEFIVTGKYKIVVPPIKELKGILNLLDLTPKRVQSNFMYYYSVLTLYGEFVKNKNSLRWKNCISDVSKSIPLPSNSLYIKRYFNKTKKIQVENLIANMRAELFQIINSAEWLDEFTKTNALEKLTAIEAFVGYPEGLMNTEYIESYCAALKINYTSYLTALMSVRESDESRKYSELLHLESNWLKHSDVLTVNAYYSPTDNTIGIPAAILQNMVFDDDRPNYLNYGMIGSVIGHELTHAFDDSGKNFDKNGNMNNWWSANTLLAFQEKVECIRNQYQNYKYPELKLNLDGNLTLGENTADNGGIKQAYLAYQNLVKRNGVDKILPGLNYTQNQMFWISAAQLWCSKSSAEAIKHQISADPHSPDRFRVIGSFSNFKEFSDDFNCPVDSPMNPSKKCKVW